MRRKTDRQKQKHTHTKQKQKQKEGRKTEKEGKEECKLTSKTKNNASPIDTYVVSH